MTALDRGSGLGRDCSAEIRPSYGISGGSCPYFGLPTPAAMWCERQHTTAWNTIRRLTLCLCPLQKQSQKLWAYKVCSPKEAWIPLVRSPQRSGWRQFFAVRIDTIKAESRSWMNRRRWGYGLNHETNGSSHLAASHLFHNSKTNLILKLKNDYVPPQT